MTRTIQFPRDGRFDRTGAPQATTSKTTRASGAHAWMRIKDVMRTMSWMLVYVFVAAAITYGWIRRHEEHIVPGEGLGYILGISGAAAMLLLLVYPLRKRKPRLRFLGSVRLWFTLHMLLGLLGPTLILFHCNFSLGATNSNVALVVMLVVAGSGLIGRHLHGKIHRRMDGSRILANDLLSDVMRAKALLGPSEAAVASGLEAIAQLSTSSLSVRSGLLGSIGNLLVFRWRWRGVRRSALRNARLTLAGSHASHLPSRERRQFLATWRRALDDYARATSRAIRFSIYERSFALWHLLHLPLFIVLVASVIVHVIGVHLY